MTMMMCQLLTGLRVYFQACMARSFAALIWLAVISITLIFVWMLADIIWQGVRGLSWQFLINAPQHAGRSGGIGPIVVATLLILMVALLVSLPLSIACAVWLTDFAPSYNVFARSVRLSLDVLAGVPSIVFGLFGFAFFCVLLKLKFSIISGGLTLACMMLPIMIRIIESGLNALPCDWRQAGAALGISRISVLRYVLLPAAAPAIVVGVILGIGRATAETAALIFTSGYVDRMPHSLMDSGRALSVHIYDLSMNVSGGDQAAYASALVLILLIVMLNGLAVSIADQYFAKKGVLI